MARGWESKAVESQQESARDAAQPAPRLSPDEASKKSDRASLMLARTSALAELQRACAAGHRAMLEQAIADLDRRIAAITPSSETRS